MVNSTLHNRVEDTILEYLDKAESHFGVTIPVIPIEYKNTGRCAGQYWPSHKKIVLNYILYSENVEDFLNRTVPHELAHYVVDFLQGKGVLPRSYKRQPHGYQWQSIMSSIFGLSASRCHTYDTSNSRRKVKRFVYKCDCKEHEISSRMHKKLSVPNTYYCKYCKGGFTYTGKAFIK